MKQKKNSKIGLGSGLSSLLGAEVEKKSDNFKMVPIELIKPGPWQPRKIFDKDELMSLSSSIKNQGIIQPVILKSNKKIKNQYFIIAGERRWRACQLAKIHEIPAVIWDDVSDDKVAELSLVENIQRSELNPIEEAEGYKRLIDDFSYDHEKVAKFIGKSRTYISNCLRLLSLPKEVLELIIDEKISQGHAKILIGLENAILLSKKIISKKLSVRQTESLVRSIKSINNRTHKSKDPNISAIEHELASKIGMRVFLKNKKNNTGTLTLEYKAADQLDRLIEIIKKNY